MVQAVCDDVAQISCVSEMNQGHAMRLEKDLYVLLKEKEFNSFVVFYEEEICLQGRSLRVYLLLYIRVGV